MNKKPVKQTSDNIQVFEGLEGVRKRPSVYIGPLQKPALFQMIKEGVENSVDEAMAGRNSYVGIKVTGSYPQKFYIIDHAGGIPVATHKKSKKSTFTTILTQLHAGGKFDDKVYQKSRGCFTGSTRIKLLDGTNPTIKDLYIKFKKDGKKFWVYAYDLEGEHAFTPKKCYNVQLTKKVNTIAIVYLDNGEKVKCTIDHPFLTFDGTYVRADSLKAGDRLRSFHYGFDKDGYETHAGRNYKLQSEYSNSPATNINGNNHQVVKVKIVKKDKAIPVYDLSVEGEHNFLLHAGVFVHNTHGMGIAITNGLSISFKAWTFRNKKWYYQAFKKGIPVTEVVKAKPKSKPLKGLKLKNRGTIIEYVPDYNIIKKSKLIDKELEAWAYDVAMLNPGVTIHLVTDKINEKYKNKKGPEEYLESIIENYKVTPIGVPFIYEDDTIVVGIQWTDYEESDGVLSYINGAYTKEGGTHMTGLFKAIAISFKPIIPKRIRVDTQTLKVGIIGFFNYKIQNPDFTNQVKSKLSNSYSTKEVYEILSKPFLKWLKYNKKTATEIYMRADNIKKALQKAKELTQEASKIKKGSNKLPLPGKLATCSAKTPISEREIYLVEGDSAGGTGKMSRDKRFQEVLALKGKIINAEKHSLSRVLKSEEVQNIIISLGLEANDIIMKRSKIDIMKRLRTGKIILLNDPDVDGDHISVLACTLFNKYFPFLFEESMIYTVNSPEYFASFKNKRYYGYSLEEIKASLPSNASNDCITKAKGWGEIDWQVLKSIAFAKNTRKLIQLTPLKNAKDKKEFIAVVGENTQKRKELLGIN